MLRKIGAGGRFEGAQTEDVSLTSAPLRIAFHLCCRFRLPPPTCLLSRSPRATPFLASDPLDIASPKMELHPFTLGLLSSHSALPA